MLVDGPTGKIVADRDLTVGLWALSHGIDLLMNANGKSYIPGILTAQLVHGFLLFLFAALFLCYQLFQRFITERGNINRGDLRLRVGPVRIQLDSGSLQRK